MLFKKEQQEQTRKNSNSLASRFNSIKNKETEASTKIVNIYYKEGCGCFSNQHHRGHVTVPSDSALENGDYIDPDDYDTLEEGWV